MGNVDLCCVKRSNVPANQRKRKPKSPIKPIPNNSQIIVRIYQKRIATYKDTQSVHTTILAEKNVKQFNDNFKFVSDKGIQNMWFGQKMNENSIGFLVQKSINNNLFIELKIKEDYVLWKKIDNEKIQVVEKDQIMVGKYHMKLVFWLQCFEGVRMRSRSANSIRLRGNQKQIMQCRVCLLQGYAGNPLLNPCKCTGSLGLIHQRCLSKWIFNNPVSFEQSTCFYKINIMRTQCQICKSSYRDFIWNRIMAIISSFEGYYAIFQLKNEKQFAQQFILFKFSDHHYSMRIGNAGKSKFLIPSFSSNSVETSLIMENGRLYLKDYNTVIGPYISTQNKSLRFNKEYKVGLFYIELSRT